MEIRRLVVIWVVVFHMVLGGLEVNIADGVLKGKMLRSRDGRPYYSYTGIPYARSPVGKFRFEAPEPAEPWTGTLDATGEPKKCIQIEDVGGEEDCLYLNVFTPKVIDGNSSLPVMFWIHGGGFFAGHGGPEDSGPEYFMDKDIVFVSINYRLGALGFLSTGDDVIPGNFGMKDQVMALRWVQKNIIHFNGDPGRVTIFGESAGGVSTGYHLISPMSKGLFHKAILQSGAPVCIWSITTPGSARKFAHTVASIAGCNYDMAKRLSSPVYAYLYDHRNEFPDGKRSRLCGMNIRVSHDELISLLKGHKRPSPLNAKDLEVSKLMVNIWYKFAVSDTPTVDGMDNGVAWPEFSSNIKSPFLYIDSARPTIVLNPFEMKYQFWNQLFLQLRRLSPKVPQKLPDAKVKL